MKDLQVLCRLAYFHSFNDQNYKTLLIILRFRSSQDQISAKRGTDLSFVLEANIKAL